MAGFGERTDIWLRLKITVKLWLLDITGNFKKMRVLRILLVSLIFLIIAGSLVYNILKKETAIPSFLKIKTGIKELAQVPTEGKEALKAQAGKAELRALNEQIKNLRIFLDKAEKNIRKEKNARKFAEKKLQILKKAGAAAPGEVRTLKKKIKKLEIGLADAVKKAEEQARARKRAEEEAEDVKKEAKATASPDKKIKVLQEKIKKLGKSLSVAEENARKEEKARKSAEKKLEAVREEGMGVKPEESKKLRTYKVEMGDTLSTIAEKKYGDSSRWKDIYNANKELLKKKGVVKGLILTIPQ